MNLQPYRLSTLSKVFRQYRRVTCGSHRTFWRRETRGFSSIRPVLIGWNVKRYWRAAVG